MWLRYFFIVLLWNISLQNLHTTTHLKKLPSCIMKCTYLFFLPTLSPPTCSAKIQALNSWVLLKWYQYFVFFLKISRLPSISRHPYFQPFLTPPSSIFPSSHPCAQYLILPESPGSGRRSSLCAWRSIHGWSSGWGHFPPEKRGFRGCCHVAGAGPDKAGHAAGIGHCNMPPSPRHCALPGRRCYAG